MSKLNIELRNFERPYYHKGKKTIYSVNYKGEVFNNKKNHKKLPLTPDSRTGYVHAMLWDMPIDLHESKGVHRMVAETFIPNPAMFRVVNHLDNNRSNNRVDNLEWTTQSENIKYAVKQGRFVTINGEANHLTKYTDKEIKEVCGLLQAGYRNKDIAKITNVKESYISSIRNREWRKDISKDYKWEVIAFKDRKGSNSYNATIDEKMAKRICKKIQKGLGNKEIADELGVKYHIVKNIRGRKAWKDVSKHFKW